MLEKRIAITVPAGPKIEDTVERILWAEANGIPDVWFSDAAAPDTLTLIAAVAHHTSAVRIGVAVTPVYTRSPAVLAASAQVISQLLPGRFVFGLGSSSQTIMGQWNGIPLDKPLTRVKETTELMREIFAGNKTNFDGKTVRSHGYRQAALDNPPPIYLAALRANMIEMAAAIGDGVIFNLWPRQALPKMMDHVRIGAERAGKNWREVEIVNRAMVLCTEDKARGREIFRAAFAPYYATPVYNSFLSWAGYEESANTINAGWLEKDRAKTGGALTDELIDEIAIIGSAAEIQDRIRADAAGGVHTHIIAPLAGASDEIQRTFEAFAGASFSF
ncbi:MAG: putative F420-dependent oxidoreductase [Gammaproteobacteria bacterium]|jgi:probable F420-dependent oxidoreductase